LSFHDFKKLLSKNSLLTRIQEKWFRKISEGKITILEQIYTLKVTDNKRKLIYKDNKLVGTKHYKIDSTKTKNKNNQNKVINYLCSDYPNFKLIIL
jgi:hypothetical protein